MIKIVNCSSCSLRHPRWQRLWLSRSRLRSKPWESSQVATAAAECVCLFVFVEIHFSSAFSMDDDCHFVGSSLL